MLKKFLMRLARKLLESALGQLTKQFNIIDEQVLNPVMKIVDIVSNGAWVGDGAAAFLDEVNTLVIPKVSSIGTDIDVTKTLVVKAEEIIVQADERVSQLVNSKLVDAFRFY